MFDRQRRPARGHLALRAAGLSALAGLFISLVSLAGCGEAAVAARAQGVDAPPRIEALKSQELERERQVRLRIPSASAMSLTRTREATLRDSGIGATMLFARDVDFRVTGQLGFVIHSMAATMTPTRAGEPIVFDDPTSVAIDVHRGEVTLDADRLTAVFGQYLFDYAGAPLRDLRVTPAAGELRVAGRMWRGAWVPFALAGQLTLGSPRTLVFHATRVNVAGVEADRLMHAAHVRMADLLTVDTPIARLSGNDIVMRAARLMPPPVLSMTIVGVKVSPEGVTLTLDDGTLKTIEWPARTPARGMLLVGGDVKFMRSMPMNLDLALHPLDEQAPFVFDLYRYRDQLSAGYMTFRPDGALDVFVPSAAAPVAVSPGSASARYNDTFLRAQQHALETARQTWRTVPGNGNEPREMVAGATMTEPRATGEKNAIAPDRLRASWPAPSIATPGTERASHGAPTCAHLSNVDFFVTGGIGFHVRSLDVQMVPKQPGDPVDLDDPNQYEIRIVGGEVLEPWPAMAALFNDYLLDYSPRSLNALSLTAHDGVLDVTGGVKLWNRVPGVWMPLSMTGTIEVLDARHLAYAPNRVSVLGVPQAGLLRALHIPLASLTPLERKGAKLTGDRLVFDQYTVFPPPLLAGRLESAEVTDAGLVLKFAREAGAELAHPPAHAKGSYVWIEGGDVKMFDALAVNARTLIHDDSRETMRFDLYDYRRDVARGRVRMRADGTLDVSLGAER
ncbi:hypothetical protein C0Z18_11140 [Trinickia dabaoshanensis]|uniref:Lipoprotein n=1 Tax=Trinickia dabaoshanensis TaxID=564714 RepID=A0A2N7VTL2_9BURK|nr:hypothetical protein [Trinickia dabaoshanensis]PMS20484.1 hypothetical protein C0Z18_11140 [Trinickia dabaoshanensis]